MGWARDAACAGMDPGIFFPERGANRAVDEAKAVCARCPVIEQCRETHQHEREGIFFGTSGNDRRRMRAGRDPWRYPSKAEHGTRSRYVAGCRCVPCCDAESVYQGQRYVERIKPARQNARALASRVQVG